MCMGLTLRARIRHLKVHILMVNSWGAEKEKRPSLRAGASTGRLFQIDIMEFIASAL